TRGGGAPARVVAGREGRGGGMPLPPPSSTAPTVASQRGATTNASATAASTSAAEGNRAPRLGSGPTRWPGGNPLSSSRLSSVITNKSSSGSGRVKPLPSAALVLPRQRL
ncbi:unnamed protein product, partial [Discosporangium mesarthrocarpum]